MKAAILHLRLDPDLKRRAEIAARANGINTSEMVRLALTHYLEKNKC